MVEHTDLFKNFNISFQKYCFEQSSMGNLINCVIHYKKLRSLFEVLYAKIDIQIMKRLFFIHQSLDMIPRQPKQNLDMSGHRCILKILTKRNLILLVPMDFHRDFIPKNKYHNLLYRPIPNITVKIRRTLNSILRIKIQIDPPNPF